jgi:hypothetical protein
MLTDGPLESEQVEQIGIAKHYVRTHPPVAQIVDFGRNDGLRLPRQSGALIQHATDLPAHGAHIPALDAAHLGVEIASGGVFDRDKGMKMEPSQLV